MAEEIIEYYAGVLDNGLPYPENLVTVPSNWVCPYNETADPNKVFFMAKYIDAPYEPEMNELAAGIIERKGLAPEEWKYYNFVKKGKFMSINYSESFVQNSKLNFFKSGKDKDKENKGDKSVKKTPAPAKKFSQKASKRALGESTTLVSDSSNLLPNANIIQINKASKLPSSVVNNYRSDQNFNSGFTGILSTSLSDPPSTNGIKVLLQNTSNVQAAENIDVLPSTILNFTEDQIVQSEDISFQEYIQEIPNSSEQSNENLEIHPSLPKKSKLDTTYSDFESVDQDLFQKLINSIKGIVENNITSFEKKIDKRLCKMEQKLISMDVSVTALAAETNKNSLMLGKVLQEKDVNFSSVEDFAIKYELILPLKSKTDIDAFFSRITNEKFKEDLRHCLKDQLNTSLPLKNNIQNIFIKFFTNIIFDIYNAQQKTSKNQSTTAPADDADNSVKQIFKNSVFSKNLEVCIKERFADKSSEQLYSKALSSVFNNFRDLQRKKNKNVNSAEETGEE